MTLEEIVQESEKAFFLFAKTCATIEEHSFFTKAAGKWSVAENMQHLVTSTTTSTLAFKLPLFIVRIVGGTPNRSSRSYDELLLKYNKKITEGGKASGRYIPKGLNIKKGKQGLMRKWAKACTAYIRFLKRNRSEKDLDNYLVGHRLLGKITLRELCYFTIFHTLHHCNIIKLRAHE